MRQLTRLFIVAILLVGCVGCDQVTKSAIRNHMSLGTTASYMRDTFRLSHTENSGVFLSLGDSLPKPARIALFQGFVSIVVLGLIAVALFWRGLRRQQIVAIALMGASGLGNLIDRLVYDGRVTDFLNLGIGHWRTGIFNVADIFGVVAVVMLLMTRGDITPSNNRVQRAGEP